MKIFNIVVVALSVFGMSAPTLADHHAGATGYALTSDGKTLVIMSDMAKPDVIKSYPLNNTLSAIAYRPVTGDLLGFGDGAVYTIDTTSGKTTSLNAKFIADAGIGTNTAVGFDFNNKIDAVRAVSANGDNLVYFPVGFGGDDPKANSVRRFTTLAYAKGDTNAGTKPMIFANAYTNAINGKKAGSTFQYALDANTDSLVSLANNAGTLSTISKVKINGKSTNITNMGGFDIVSHSEGENKAYAILQVEGQDKAGLYVINLNTADASLITQLGMGSIKSFAASKTH